MPKAKQAANKRVFKCIICGKAFSGGRALGKHYDQAPSHRPAGKPKKASKAKESRGATGLSAEIKRLLDSVDAEITNHEQAIKDLRKKRNQLRALNW